MRVNLDDKFFTDNRIIGLSEEAGEEIATSRGRLIGLWLYCFRERRSVLSDKEVEIHSGRMRRGKGKYGDLLVRHLLAEERDGEYEISGTKKRMKYLLEFDELQREARSKGGKVAAEACLRGEKGKFLPRRSVATPAEEPSENQLTAIQMDNAPYKNQLNQLSSSSTSPSSSSSSSASPSASTSTSKKKDLVVEPSAPRLAKVNGVGVWKAYSEAYEKRWGVIPPRHQVNNTLAKRVAEKLGMEDGPKVAEFYLTHNDRFYLSTKHALNILLRDADKLYTEWKLGRASTYDDAIRGERRASNVNAARDFMEMDPKDNIWEDM